MHRVLERQLRKLGIPSDGSLPSSEQWTALLTRIERTYEDADQDRYTLERSIELSSGEMQALHRSLASERDKLRSIFESAALGIVRLDPAGSVLDANTATLTMFGQVRAEIEGRSFTSLFDESDDTSREAPSESDSGLQCDEGGLRCGERRLRRADGTFVWIYVTTNWVTSSEGVVEFGTAILENVTPRKLLEVSLRHAQKLESVGRLAAGIAHEINTPVQFVSDNAHFLKASFETMLQLYKQHAAIVEMGPEELAARYALASQQADFDYIATEIPRAVAETLDGLQRVAAIVRSMKAFAHADHAEQSQVDINAALASTFIVARHEFKGVAETVTDFGELPPVLCYPGDLNQVFLNLFVNAAHAIADVVAVTNSLGRITVTTRREGEDVVIAVRDTGTGIPDEVRGQIFEPFFTTKQVGQGTGQGLALARAIVVEKHAGELWLDTVVGQGTTFYVRLPISGKRAQRRAA